MVSSPWQRRRTWISRFLGILLMPLVLCLASGPSPVLAQFLPDLKGQEAQLTPEAIIPVFSQGNVEIAPVFLDGRIIGAIPGYIEVKPSEQSNDLRPFSVRERAHVIHSRLQRILTSLEVYSQRKLKAQGITGIASQKQQLNQLLNVFVEKDSRGSKVMISFPREDPPELLYTVTPADVSRVRLESSDPAAIARRASVQVRLKLLQAWEERQVPFLVARLREAFLLFLALWGISTLGLLAQKKLKRLGEVLSRRLAEELKTQSAEVRGEQGNDYLTVDVLPRGLIKRRQQLSVISFYRAVLYWGQWLLWTAGLAELAGLFPATRPLRNWIIGISLRNYFYSSTGPLSNWPPLDWLLSFGEQATIGLPLLILLLVMLTRISIRTGNLLCYLYVRKWAEGQPEERLTLRAPTLVRALKGWVQVVVYLLLGMVVVYHIHQFGAVTQAVAVFLGFLSFALSLASQNLLKDLIGGFMILAEDQYAVGDVVIIDAMGGLVEEVGLRITKLRNLDGELITIPNGTIGMVRNLSSNWSRVNYAIEVGVAEDPERVMEIMDAVAKDLFADPEWKEKILEAPEILGIDEITHHGMLIRMLIRTLPLQQWAVAREYRLRLKKALDASGISVGVPRLELHPMNR